MIILFISVSIYQPVSYNLLLELSGKPALQLGEKEAPVYIDTEITMVSRTAMLNQVLAGQPKVELDGSPIHLTSVQTRF